jgi:hypothetical protein
MQGLHDHNHVIKWYDFLGNELHVGDTIVLSRTNKNLRLVKIEKLDYILNERLRWTVTHVFSLVSEEITTQPIFNRGPLVTFRYVKTKTYKSLTYPRKYGIKIRSVMKV